jgi:hypothetical protein
MKRSILAEICEQITSLWGLISPNSNFRDVVMPRYLLKFVGRRSIRQTNHLPGNGHRTKRSHLKETAADLWTSTMHQGLRDVHRDHILDYDGIA